MKCISPYTSNRKPRLLISRDLLEKVRLFVAKVPLECQWFHLVTRVETPHSLDFVLEDIFVPEQTSSGTEVDSSAESMAKLVMETRTERGWDLATLHEHLMKMSVWCHSHHNMSVGPSGTDETTFSNLKSQLGQNNNPVIMLIFNKRDEYYSRIWDPITDTTHIGVELLLMDTSDHTDVDDWIKSKIKTPAPKIWKGANIPAAFDMEKFGKWAEFDAGDTDGFFKQWSLCKQEILPQIPALAALANQYEKTKSKEKKDQIFRKIESRMDKFLTEKEKHYVSIGLYTPVEVMGCLSEQYDPDNMRDFLECFSSDDLESFTEAFANAKALSKSSSLNLEPLVEYLYE